MFLLFKGLESHYIEQLVYDKLSTLLANASVVGRENNGCPIASKSLAKAKENAIIETFVYRKCRLNAV
jgi:hypothetical protein